ncbi:hypothetical protein VM1G_07991 [Cytospora mali]|uniref:Uncharacterized protein n=1 Tax=Cytospora mali TaxID=578113 RepID=A0A194W8D5_CYTMA|nr:hypothetical protein VM1G_07991 [Valsa mali]
MSGGRSSSMDINLSYSNSSRGGSRTSAAEARRLQEERLQSYTADNGNNLYQRLWDRAGSSQQYTQHTQHTQQPAQRNSGHSSNYPSGA